MSEIKPFLTYEEQIEKLKSRGCIIKDVAFCKTVLKEINYYRLSAYFLPFKNTDDTYNSNITFEKNYQIYEFDRKLRNLLLSATEVIEIDLRARLSYFFAEKYGPLGYLDEANFNKKHNHEKFCETINHEIENNKKVLFVKHHIENYNSEFPMWVISELFTFGMLSYFYNDMTIADRKLFAGKDYDDMVSWLRCCTDLRNICAHYGRLYFRIFSAMPKGFNISENQKRRLWGTILAVKALYPSNVKWNNEFMPAIESLFEEYSSYINLYHLAFPKDWALRLKK